MRSDIGEQREEEQPIEADADELRPVVVRARAGDLAAYEALVVRFQDLAVGYAYARLGDLHLAEDVAQEAFLQAHLDLPALRDPAAFPGWFRRLVARQCGRATRGKRVRVVPLAAAAGVRTPAPGPDKSAEARERREAVRRAVRELPAPERAAVVLFYLGGYAQGEVARFLGLPPTVVNNRLHAARGRLRRSMLTMVEEDLHGARPSRDPRFAAGVLRTLAPRPEADAPRIYAALEAAATGWGRTQWRDGRLAHSRFDWAASRIGLAGDHLAAVFGVYDVTVRVGTAHVRTAGVNLEFADPEHDGAAGQDGRGALEETAVASVAALRAGGYDLSVAFGREALFSRLGYAPGWRETMWFVRTDDLPAAPLGATLESFEPVHRDDLAALYNREHEGLTGTAVRPTYLRNKHPGELAGYLWRGPDGAPAGYVVVGREGTAGWRNPALLGANHRGFERLLWHDESAGDPETRLRVLGQLARRMGCPEVAFDRLHALSPLGRRLRQGRCRIEQEYRRYVVRIVNLQTLFEKLAPGLTHQLGASPLAEWSGPLAVSTPDERVVLEIERGRVRVLDRRHRAGHRGSRDAQRDRGGPGAGAAGGRERGPARDGRGGRDRAAGRGRPPAGCPLPGPAPPDGQPGPVATGPDDAPRGTRASGDGCHSLEELGGGTRGDAAGPDPARQLAPFPPPRHRRPGRLRLHRPHRVRSAAGLCPGNSAARHRRAGRGRHARVQPLAPRAGDSRPAGAGPRRGGRPVLGGVPRPLRGVRPLGRPGPPLRAGRGELGRVHRAGGGHPAAPRRPTHRAGGGGRHARRLHRRRLPGALRRRRPPGPPPVARRRGRSPAGATRVARPDAHGPALWRVRSSRRSGLGASRQVGVEHA